MFGELGNFEQSLRILCRHQKRCSSRTGWSCGYYAATTDYVNAEAERYDG